LENSEEWEKAHLKTLSPRGPGFLEVESDLTSKRPRSYVMRAAER